jgi:hypothetical protein
LSFSAQQFKVNLESPSTWVGQRSGILDGDDAGARSASIITGTEDVPPHGLFRETVAARGTLAAVNFELVTLSALALFYSLVAVLANGSGSEAG